MVSKRLSFAREWIERHFQLPATASDDEVQARADMLRDTMMDYGDVNEWEELHEYLGLRQQ